MFGNYKKPSTQLDFSIKRGNICQLETVKVWKCETKLSKSLNND